MTKSAGGETLAPAPKVKPPAVSAPASPVTNRWGWKGLWFLPLVAGLGTLGWIYGVPLVLGPMVSAKPMVRTDFVQTLVASGHVETPFRVSISSQITGVVTAIPVAEGQKVSAGETLIQLDDNEARASVVVAEGQLAQADARVRQVRDLTLPSAEQSLVEAKATLMNAQQIYNRASKLFADGISTRVVFDDATKNLDVARAQVRAAELTVFTNSPGGADFTVAETQAAQARATLRATQTRLGYTVIKAARAGVLIWRDVEVGNGVQPGRELMRLSPAGELQITVQIDEKNLGLIAVEQQALASADAFASERFPAIVSFINPAVDLQRASVEVKLNVPSPPAYLRQDMTVSVDIEVARRPKALVVPLTDIHDLTLGRPWVLKAVDGHARRQTITVGLVSAGKAEVLTGLAAGDVIVPASLQMRDGARIRLHSPPVARP